VTRTELEKRAWWFTHKDYKALVDGKKSVLVSGPRGTTLTPLSALPLSKLEELAKPRSAPSVGHVDLPPGSRRG
jgi:hypothetical protein